ncbi:MAG TPA: hypothetical protein PLL10_06385, partial [Elusimicrobiales bacterium]|nr:hypothetical protein [Elusimicrobiales bacterium]
ASHRTGARTAAPVKLAYLKAAPPFAAGEQAPRLKKMDTLLKVLFPAQKSVSRLTRLPSPAGQRRAEAGLFMDEFAAFLQTSVSVAEREGRHWLAKSGFISLAPYAAALVRAGFGRGQESGLNQKALDLALDSLVKIVKSIPAEARGAQWLVELGGSIIGFWNSADMLERALLMSEALAPQARKAVAPMLARGRAWRRWLGFKAEPAWAHPSSQILPDKAAGTAKTARCARCGIEIRDYGYIADADDSGTALCGDCAPALSCPECGGPLRQVSSGGADAPVYVCMECRKRHRFAGRRR